MYTYYRNYLRNLSSRIEFRDLGIGVGANLSPDCLTPILCAALVIIWRSDQNADTESYFGSPAELS